MLPSFIVSGPQKSRVSHKPGFQTFHTFNLYNHIGINLFYGRSSALRRQMFTIFLRQGVYFAIDDKFCFNSCLKEYNNSITSCINLFLEGYTEFCDGCLKQLQDDMHEGICYQFDDMEKYEILEEKTMFKP